MLDYIEAYKIKVNKTGQKFSIYFYRDLEMWTLEIWDFSINSSACQGLLSSHQIRAGTKVPVCRRMVGLKSHFQKRQKKKVEQKPNLLERKLFSKSLRAGTVKSQFPKEVGMKFPLPKRN